MDAHFPDSVRRLRGDRGAGALALATLAALVLAAWFGWAALAQVTLRETSVSARLEAGVAIHSLQSDVGGRVNRSHMRLGQRVVAGELLLELDAEATRLELAEQAARLAGIEQQIEALLVEIDTRERARTDGHTARLTAVREARARVSEALLRAAQASDESERLVRLSRHGDVAELDALRATTEAKSKVSEVSVRHLTSARLAAEARFGDSEQGALLAAAHRELALLRAQATSLRTSMERLTLEIARRRLIAPVAGRLGDIAPLPAGAYVAVGTRLCTIVPDAPVRVVAEFPWARAVGRIRPGQTARVRLSGFPWVEWGSLGARVGSVATEARAETVRVELVLDARQSARVPIEHGLPAEVLVDVERVTPLSLLLRTLGRAVSSPPAFPPRGPASEPARPLAERVEPAASPLPGAGVP